MYEFGPTYRSVFVMSVTETCTPEDSCLCRCVEGQPDMIGWAILETVHQRIQYL